MGRRSGGRGEPLWHATLADRARARVEQSLPLKLHAVCFFNSSSPLPFHTLSDISAWLCCVSGLRRSN